MPKQKPSPKTQAKPADVQLEIAAINAGLMAPSATDLVVAVENGETAEMLARVQTLGQSDFIEVLRAIQTVEKALSDYAMSWKNAESWGNGTPYPGDEKAKAASA